MPRKKALAYLYSVFTTSYASAEIKRGVEAGTERISDPKQLTTQIFYSGISKAQAERAFSRAAIEAYNSPLAFLIALQRDSTLGSMTLARVRVERR